MAVALLKFTQDANVGGDGEALVGDLADPFEIANSDNTGIGSWEIQILEVPYGSAVTKGVLAQANSSTPAGSVTPDVAGGWWRIQLRVWPQANRQGTPDTDIRCFGVPGTNGLIAPPPQVWPLPLPHPSSGRPGAKPNEINVGGQDGGWAGQGNDGLLRHAIRLIGIGDVVGPAGATADALALFDGTTGKLLKVGVTLAALLGSLSAGRPDLFGAGTDGPLTASSGTTTLTRDTYYSTVTLSGTAKIDTAGYRLYMQAFDATNAAAGSIVCTVGAGGNATASSASNAGGVGISNTARPLGGSGDGGAGGDNVGVAGAGNAGTSVSIANGGAGGAGGAGGTSGGAGGTAGASTSRQAVYVHERDLSVASATTGYNLIRGGAGGGGGGSGGTSSGGHGGGGGAGGAVMWVAIGELITGVSTPAGVIAATGGAGGSGAAGQATNHGGGAGGGGGGGGWIHCLVGKRTGPAVPDFFKASGGAGGAGGASGGGTGSAGAAGTGGEGGLVVLINMAANTVTVSTRGAASGATGGTAPLAA